MTASNQSGWIPPDSPSAQPLHRTPQPFLAQPVQYAHPGSFAAGPLYGYQHPGVALADFGQRLVAHLLDQLVLGVVAGIIWLPVRILIEVRYPMPVTAPGATAPAVRDPEADAAVLGIYLVVFAVLLVLHAVYHTVCVALWGTTVGKRMMKLRVVRAADGGAVGWGRAAGRAATWALITAIPCLGYLGPMWMLWDKPNRQTLHDKAAGTIVVRTDFTHFGARAVFTG